MLDYADFEVECIGTCCRMLMLGKAPLHGLHRRRQLHYLPQPWQPQESRIHATMSRSAPKLPPCRIPVPGPQSNLRLHRYVLDTHASRRRDELIQRSTHHTNTGSRELVIPGWIKLVQNFSSSVIRAALMLYWHRNIYWEQIKRVVCTEEASESSLVHGVVFRKNVVHRRMRSAIVQPRIMLLRGSLEYERTNSKLSSLNASFDQVCPPSGSSIRALR